MIINNNFSTIAVNKNSRKIEAYKIFWILYPFLWFYNGMYNYSTFINEKQYFLLYSVKYEGDQLGDVSSPFR